MRTKAFSVADEIKKSQLQVFYSLLNLRQLGNIVRLFKYLETCGKVLHLRYGCTKINHSNFLIFL